MILFITRFLSIPFCFYFLIIGLGMQEVAAQKNNSDIAREYFDKGLSLYYAEAYEKGIEYYNKAIVIAKEIKDDTLLCTIITAKGHAYVMNDQNQEALDAYYKALEVAKKIKNVDKEVIANSGLVLVFKKTNQYDRALAISRKTLQSIDKTSFKNKKAHANIITTNSEVYLDTEQYDSVIYYADQGIAISKSLDHKEGLVDLYIKKGVVFYYQEDYAQAFDYLFTAEKLLKEHEIRNKFYPTVNSNYFIASCYYQQGAYDKAIDRLHTTIAASEKKDLLKIPVRQSHLLLANCYGKKMISKMHSIGIMSILS